MKAITRNFSTIYEFSWFRLRVRCHWSFTLIFPRGMVLRPSLSRWGESSLWWRASRDDEFPFFVCILDNLRSLPYDISAEPASRWCTIKFYCIQDYPTPGIVRLRVPIVLTVFTLYAYYHALRMRVFDLNYYVEKWFQLVIYSYNYL